MQNRRNFLKQGSFYLGGTLFMPYSMKELAGIICNRENQQIKYVQVASLEDRYLGWPANNGIWKWDGGLEILVGFTDGPFDQEGGFHRIGNPQLSKLSRSKDGGKTWEIESPDNFVGSAGSVISYPGDIHFGHNDFALRVSSAGYHGNDDIHGHFFISYDRGKSWEGGYRFNGLQDNDELKGLEITSRTNYLVTGENSIQIFMTARNPKIQHADRRDKTFVLETKDGGRTFQFISWIVPWGAQDNRAAMPSGVRTKDGKMVVAVRVKNPFDLKVPSWIDCYISANNGRSWEFLSTVGQTGFENGNPPALITLKDGRLACCYANRDTRQLLIRYSWDNGKTWDKELVIRDNPYTYDMGYPQLAENKNGELVAIYYLATEFRSNNYIEAAIWQP